MCSRSSSRFQPCNALHILKYTISDLCQLPPQAGNLHETSRIAGGFHGRAGGALRFELDLFCIPTAFPTVQLGASEHVPKCPESGTRGAPPLSAKIDRLSEDNSEGRGPLHPAQGAGGVNTA